MKLKMNKLLMFIGIIFYVCGLHVVYTYFISPEFSYFGYINLHPSKLVQTVSLIFVLFPLLFFDTKVKVPSRVVFWIIYTMVYIPAMIVPDYVRLNGFDEIINLKISLLVALFLLYFVSELPKLPIYSFKNSTAATGGLLILFSLSMWAIIIQTFGLHFNFSEVDDVYDLREAYRDQVNRFSGYAINWQSKIINALLVALGIIKKQYWFIFIGVFGQIFIFSITGQKSVALSSVFILGIIFCVQKNGKYFVLRFIYSLIGLICLTAGVDKIFNSSEYTSLFVRRMLITPGLLLSYYFDFFSDNPKIYLSHSIFKSFIDYPYDRLPPFLIGKEFFGREDLAANANLWADSFANFGYLGILFFTLILAGILYLYDCISNNRNFIVSVVLIAMPAWSLVDTSLMTSILTHGILLALLINYFFKTNREEEWHSEKNIDLQLRPYLE
ncbi:putative B-band O-antigen polymerase [Carnobacterium maltaromaticum]|uniref:hypothetical protein n=1 Tax=Carnobacterium maltaromaticum TaxID=2751 RepID=UPI00191BC6DE|nr:hypothetical protein [Carnobacterium maltaromaticum]CAD5902616.1 putative B-band O-antigen polymerase [Carnobacterium maltaromaticum]